MFSKLLFSLNQGYSQIQLGSHAQLIFNNVENKSATIITSKGIRIKGSGVGTPT